MKQRRRTFRSRVLRVLNDSHQWMQARDIAPAAGLTYHQTLYALNALLNSGAIARTGRKSTARWGSLAIDTHPATDAIATLEAVFRDFTRIPN